MYWLIEAYFVIVESGLETIIYLESLAASHDSESKLVMYFTVNNAFTNYLNKFNLTEDVEIPKFYQ